MPGDDLSHCALFNVTSFVSGREEGVKQRRTALFLKRIHFHSTIKKQKKVIFFCIVFTYSYLCKQVSANRRDATLLRQSV